jgi:hypothetical protein
MAASTYSMSQGWTAKSSSPWNAGILLDVPNIMNQYPPGLSHGAWRTSPASASTSSLLLEKDIATGSKRPRPPYIRSNRRAPPPPPAPPLSLPRLQTVPVAFPPDDNPFTDRLPSQHDENQYSYNDVIYKSPPTRTRILQSYSQSQSAGYSYPMRQFQHSETLIRQRAAADKEARLKVIASILLNRVNVVGKPMRRRPRSVGLDGPRMYVRSGLGQSVSVAE